MDSLKQFDKKYIDLRVDYSRTEVRHFNGLLAIRNSIIHSNSNFEYVKKYSPLIKRMTMEFASISITKNGYIVTQEQFCMDSLEIVKKFFFYIFKLSIKKFPNYRTDEPDYEIINEFNEAND